MKLPTHLIRHTLTTSILTALLACNVASAEKHSKTKQHGAHEHGVARMTIATTDNGMEVSLETPAANVFGFEYLASSDEDHHTIHKAVETLEAGDKIFLASDAAGCKLASFNIKSAQVEAHDREKHGDGQGHDKHDDHKDEHDHDKHDDHKDEHDHDKHDDHKDEHDHDKHDDHKDEHDHDKHDDHKDERDHDKHEEDHKDGHDHDHKSEGTHNDVDATWNFSCDKPAALTQVEVRLFSSFPKGFEEIDVDWITATKSGSVELEKDGVVALK